MHPHDEHCGWGEHPHDHAHGEHCGCSGKQPNHPRIERKKKSLTTQIWRYVISKPDEKIRDYTQGKTDLESAIGNLRNKMRMVQKALAGKEAELRKWEKQLNNPIKISYELLWDEVRREDRNNATIQNILRRILENYFKLLGGISQDKLYEKFDGEEKLRCKRSALDNS